MKRLRLLIIVFCLALSVPMGYLVWRTYAGMKQEEISKLAYFSNALFEEIENDLARLVEREEARAIDEYSYWMSPPDAPLSPPRRSPLSQAPGEPYITGYFQNNPDGTLQTPLVDDVEGTVGGKSALLAQLSTLNQSFNRKRMSERPRPTPPRAKAKMADAVEAGLADRYLKPSRPAKSDTGLGQKEKRVERITERQALNVVKQEASQARAPLAGNVPSELEHLEEVPGWEAGFDSLGRSPAPSAETYRQRRETLQAEAGRRADHKVEVAPMQSVFIDDNNVFVFRRIVIESRIYRQGFILGSEAFLEYLINTHFSGQPMAGYARLRMAAHDGDRMVRAVESGAESLQPVFKQTRYFPAPFGFLSAVLSSDQIPKAPGRGALNLMIAFFSLTMLLGLFAIYRNARGAFELSERRAKFVSSVTHELKTPLANIRMYVEMLEQGIARDTEREQEYFRVLTAENARLSRLITNILELSKLEKKQRRLDLKPHNLNDTFGEVRKLMAERVRQEGFVLTAEDADIAPFPYDGEVMIQILINLVENSLKFGRHFEIKEIRISAEASKQGVSIHVTDTGPGIRQQDLKKIFDDFYRAEAPLIRQTAGTGIGLALVKKYVHAMGGRVHAENNSGKGCRITITLPR